MEVMHRLPPASLIPPTAYSATLSHGGACVRACVRVCVRACVRVCMCVCISVSICIYTSG